MKNLLESIIFTKKRFKELAKINESGSQEAASQEAKPSAEDIADEWETKIEEANKDFKRSGSADTVENDILGPFLVKIAEKLGDSRTNFSEFIRVETREEDDPYGDGMGGRSYKLVGEIYLNDELVGNWSSQEDGYNFSIDMEDYQKKYFITALKQIFPILKQ